MLDDFQAKGMSRGKTYESVWREIKPQLYKEGKPDPDQQDVVMEFAMAVMSSASTANPERDRVANSKLILVSVTSPPPGCEIEINEAATVRVLLEKVAPLYGLNKSAAPSLQAEFNEAILGHDLELKGAGMYDESLCSVLGVEAALLAAKAKNLQSSTGYQQKLLSMQAA